MRAPPPGGYPQAPLPMGPHALPSCPGISSELCSGLCLAKGTGHRVLPRRQWVPSLLCPWCPVLSAVPRLESADPRLILAQTGSTLGTDSAPHPAERETQTSGSPAGMHSDLPNQDSNPSGLSGSADKGGGWGPSCGPARCPLHSHSRCPLVSAAVTGGVPAKDRTCQVGSKCTGRKR